MTYLKSSLSTVDRFCDLKQKNIRRNLFYHRYKQELSSYGLSGALQQNNAILFVHLLYLRLDWVLEECWAGHCWVHWQKLDHGWSTEVLHQCWIPWRWWRQCGHMACLYSLEIHTEIFRGKRPAQVSLPNVSGLCGWEKEKANRAKRSQQVASE